MLSFGSFPKEFVSKDNQRSLSFAGANPKNAAETLAFARAVSPEATPSHIDGFIIEHEAAHCLGNRNKDNLAITTR